jgi:hypothetical protein
MKIKILILIIFYSRLSFAFMESYYLFGSDEFQTLNGPKKIDGEYYSDLLAFRLTSSLNNDFVKATQAYDIYVGSINSKQFAIQQRLKIQQSIGKKLNFELGYIEKENFEEGRQQLFSGLNYDLFEKFNFGFRTSLFSQKDQNDFGVYTDVLFSESHKIKFFLNFTDFGFNKRNELNAKDLKSPLQYGILGQIIKDQNLYLEYYLFQNSQVDRQFTDTDLVYTFEDIRLGLRGQKKVNTNYLNFDLELFKGKEGLTNISVPDPLVDEFYDRSGGRILFQVQTLKWIYGIEGNIRSWTNFEDQVVKHLNFMPHIWYKVLSPSKYLLIPKDFDLGLETSVHKAEGLKSLRAKTDENNDLNSRFNVRLNYNLSENAKLNFLLSADLDEFSWEGGGGQFQILF